MHKELAWLLFYLSLHLSFGDFNNLSLINDARQWFKITKETASSCAPVPHYQFFYAIWIEIFQLSPGKLLYALLSLLKFYSELT